MDKDKTTGPPRRSTAEIRREREAEALRENLRRRKEQQRAREAPAADEAWPKRETTPDEV
jgi:hypothetical protein